MSSNGKMNWCNGQIQCTNILILCLFFGISVNVMFGELFLYQICNFGLHCEVPSFEISFRVWIFCSKAFADRFHVRVGRNSYIVIGFAIVSILIINAVIGGREILWRGRNETCQIWPVQMPTYGNSFRIACNWDCLSLSLGLFQHLNPWLAGLIVNVWYTDPWAHMLSC